MSAPQQVAGASVKYSQQYRRCGKPGCPTCTPPGRGHGPYWYAFWWEGGRVRSRYLGKQQPSIEPAPSPAVAATAPKGGLRVRTLGSFDVWRAGEPVSGTHWGRRKAAALFKCLLGAPHHRLHREQLIELLFPEAGPTEAAKGLRSAVYLLRQVLDDDDAPTSHIQSTGQLLTLVPAPDGEPDPEWLDAAAFARAAAAALAGRDLAACRTALVRYGGDYLPEDRYEEWADGRREELRGQHLALLLHLADLAAAAGELEEALRCLRTVLTVDRCHEDAARGLMELLARDGRRSEALEVYRALAKALEEEIGEAPTRATRAVRARLLAEAPVALVPEAPHTNLPVPLTGFIGRQWECAEVAGLLHHEASGRRLLTLIGPGGCGKTRLAIEVARGLLADYPDGVFLAELAALADPQLLPLAVARALGLSEEPQRPAPDQLAAYLAPKRLLLVLDNCEHMVEACAALSAALLRVAPGLRILATSQAALGVLGEAAWRVPSLSVPEGAVPAADLAAYEAVQLFIDRAQAARPRFALTERNAQAVLPVCRRLDGIPLAIELAAARLSSLSVEQLAARLDDRFTLLSAGNRTALPRQQTLRATIEWSYNLLSPAERLLLQRLSAFVGGWTLEAAEAVCAGSGLPERTVLDRLDGLVGKSLAQADTADEGPARYRLLETVRAYAHERLEEAGELTTMRTRHLRWSLDFAQHARAALRGPEQAAWLEQLEAEHDNMRAALAWALESRVVDTALQLAWALEWFWYIRGHHSEGRGWLEKALSCSSGEETPALMRALACKAAGNLAWRQGDYAGARAFYEQGLAHSRTLGDKKAIAALLDDLGTVAFRQGDYAGAQALHAEGLALFREVGDGAGMASTLNNLGTVAYVQGDYPAAQALHEESLVLFRALGDRDGTAMLIGNLGKVAHARQDQPTARSLIEESLVLFREVGDRMGAAESLNDLAQVAMAQGDQQGDQQGALAAVGESLILYREVGERAGMASALTTLGTIAYRQGDHERAAAALGEGIALSHGSDARAVAAEGLEVIAWVAAAREQAGQAARLGGAAAALREAMSMSLLPAQRAGHDEAMEAVRAALGEEVFVAAMSEGRALRFDQAVAEAEALCATLAADQGRA